MKKGKEKKNRRQWNKRDEQDINEMVGGRNIRDEEEQ